MVANEDTNTIGYDTKFLISNVGRYPPICWKVSKIQPKMDGDIVTFAMTQEQFNPAVDNYELMLADYYLNAVAPESPDEIVSIENDLEIIYSGQPSVRAGGGYKKFTVQSKVDTPVDSYVWSISFPDGDESKLEYIAQGNTCKVKCLNDYSLIGKTFVLSVNDGANSKNLIVEVASL